MRTLSSFVGVVIALGAAGCGSVVIPTDGGGGSSAEGGSGGASNVPSNPSECPFAEVDLTEECAVPDLSCTYEEEKGCSVTYVCECAGDLLDGDCEFDAHWQPTSASCDPAAVDCEDAYDGATCALPNDYCFIAYGGCMNEDRWCDENHTWHIFPYQNGSQSCPEALPTADASCDTCKDAPACFYTVETECGPAEATAGCGPDSDLWQIMEPICKPPS